jgi:hypothetical protein
MWDPLSLIRTSPMRLIFIPISTLYLFPFCLSLARRISRDRKGIPDIILFGRGELPDFCCLSLNVVRCPLTRHVSDTCIVAANSMRNMRIAIHNMSINFHHSTTENILISSDLGDNTRVKSYFLLCIYKETSSLSRVLGSWHRIDVYPLLFCVCVR